MRSVSVCDTVWVSERERGCCVRVGEWAADTGPGSDTEEGELVRKKQRTTLLFKHVGQEGRKVCRWKSARSDEGEKLEYSTGGVLWEMCTIWESLHEGLTYRASLSLVLVRVKSMEESGRTRSSLPITFAEKCPGFGWSRPTDVQMCVSSVSGWFIWGVVHKKVTVHQSGFDTLDQVHIIGHLTW